jgi:hypothetical protein
MLRKALFGAAVALVAGSAAALAQTEGRFLRPRPDEPATRVGTRGANFLEIGVGARAQAMAGALTGLAEGASSMYWNSSGLAAVSGLDAAFSRADLYTDLDISHVFAGVALPFAGGGLGLSYIRLDSGDIPRTNEDFPDGGDVVLGNIFRWSSTAVGLHYGRRLTDRLAVGVGARIINEGLNDAAARWWGLDVGTQFNTGLYGLTIGAALANIGPSAKMEGTLVHTQISNSQVFPVQVPINIATQPAQLPTVFRFSVVSNLMGPADALLAPSPDHDLRAVAELADAVDTDLETALAAEYSFKKFLFLRVGQRFRNERQTDFRSGSHGFSWGGGIRLPLFGRTLTFDYARTTLTELENVQVFSFEFSN